MLIGLLALAGLGYYFFVMRGEATLDTEVGGAGAGELETEVFLRKLEDLRSITLPTAVFSDSRFTTLKNFGTSPEAVPYGREMPFSLP